MKRLLLFAVIVLLCAPSFGQKRDKRVVEKRILAKDAAAVPRFHWGRANDTSVFLGSDIYRVSFNDLRRNVSTPLKGEMVAAGVSAARIYSDTPGDILVASAFAAGRVFRSVGGEVTIDHGNGFESRYSNLREVNVSEGADVHKGSVVGKLTKGEPLVFSLLFEGNPIEVAEIFDPATGLATYAGDLYIYRDADSVFVSRLQPMLYYSDGPEELRVLFTDRFREDVAARRERRTDISALDVTARDEAEITLNDLEMQQMRSDTLRVRNIIEL